MLSFVLTILFSTVSSYESRDSLGRLSFSSFIAKSSVSTTFMPSHKRWVGIGDSMGFASFVDSGMSLGSSWISPKGPAVASLMDSGSKVFSFTWFVDSECFLQSWYLFVTFGAQSFPS